MEVPSDNGGGFSNQPQESLKRIMQITLRMTNSGQEGPVFAITGHRSLVIADVEPAEEVEGF